MSDYIQYELQALLFFCLSGILIALIYDFLRVLRRVIPHSTSGMGVEDLLYWTACGFFLFHQIFLKCDGNIRSYAVLGTVLGAVGYHMTVSALFVSILTKVLAVPVRGLFFLIKRLLFLKKRGKIFVDKRRRLKNNKRVHRFGKIKKQSRRPKENPYGNVQHRSGRNDSVGSASVRGTESAQPAGFLSGKRSESESADRGRTGTDQGN